MVAVCKMFFTCIKQHFRHILNAHLLYLFKICHFACSPLSNNIFYISFRFHKDKVRSYDYS